MGSSNMQGMQQGDVEGAVERWGDAVWRLCFARLRNRADAEDAFQNTFFALVRACPTFESAEHEKAWLLRCACNCVTDIFRVRKRHRAVSLDDEICANAACESNMDAETSIVDDEELANALAHLSDAQRTVVHLYYFEGYSIQEISHITGQKPSTVQSHLHRARKALKIEMEGALSCGRMNSNIATMTYKKA